MPSTKELYPNLDQTTVTFEYEGFPRLRGGGGPPTLIELNHTQHRMHVEWARGFYLISLQGGSKGVIHCGGALKSKS